MVLVPTRRAVRTQSPATSVHTPAPRAAAAVAAAPLATTSVTKAGGMSGGPLDASLCSCISAASHWPSTRPLNSCSLVVVMQRLPSWSRILLNTTSDRPGSPKPPSHVSIPQLTDPKLSCALSLVPRLWCHPSVLSALYALPFCGRSWV